MGLKARAAALREQREQALGTKKCLLMRIHAELAGEEQAELTRMIAEKRTFTTAGLAGILTEEGYRVSASTVANHREGRCGCAK